MRAAGMGQPELPERLENRAAACPSITRPASRADLARAGREIVFADVG